MQQAIQKNKWWAIAVFFLIILNLATLATFWIMRIKEKDANGMFSPARKDGAALFLIQQLSLDSAQQQAFNELKNQHQQGTRSIRKKLRTAKENFFELLSDSAVSNNIIQEKSAAIASLEQEIELLNFQHFQQVRKLCTPQQQTKFDAIIKDVLKQIGPPPPPRMMPPKEREHDFSPQDNRPPPPNGEHPFPPPPKEAP